jgi:hypothetical protein
MLEGNSTVNGGPLDLSGRTLQAGEQAVIRRGPRGQPNLIEIGKIPSDRLGLLEERAAMACMAKRTVYFDTRERSEASGGRNSATAFGGDDNSTEEIVAIPVVPTNLAPDITISPSTLPPTVPR